MAWIVGVDVGGTFTDFFAMDDVSGDVKLWKRPSTPTNPSKAIVSGLEELSKAHGVPLSEVARLCHGTTVATNALIERRGQPVTLVTTKGFRDLIEIGRQTRPHLYDLQLDHAEPLVPRERRLEISERILSDGSIRTPIDAGELDSLIDTIRESGTRSVAVCFLFSFLSPVHEEAVAARIRHRLPNIRVSASSEVQPEFREYERFTTTIINAYLQPVLDDYLQSLQEHLAEALPQATVGLNQSSGGLMSITRARAFPVRTALSGPAAGVVGAVQIARMANRPNVITIDVGGTSADVALVRNARMDITYGRDVDGFPIRLPMVDISTVGAGGGSIAWFDRDGLLKVGPTSAGAEPGPACYGLGGRDATLSDANLVLGRLSDRLAGGSMQLDTQLAREAVDRIARTMDKTPEEAAAGIVGIAVANMVRAIRGLSVERGHDPREFVLMPFGGAGPLHARDVAIALGVSEILVPPAPGILCALGLVVSDDAKEDFVASGRCRCESGVEDAIGQRLVNLMGLADAWHESERLGHVPRRLEFRLDMRYVGQNFELGIDVAQGAQLSRSAIPGCEELKRMFFVEHERAYGFHDPNAAVEIVNFRLTIRLGKSRGDWTYPVDTAAAALSPTAHRPVFFDPDRSVMTPVYQRGSLASGTVLNGPIVIEQLDATTLIYPGDVANVDSSGNILIEVTP